MESRAGVAGALSRVLAVTVRYESNGERRALPLVVKLPPRDPFGRLFVAEAQFDTREILFYTELAPALNKLAEEALGPGAGLPVPKCIKARLPGLLILLHFFNYIFFTKINQNQFSQQLSREK